MSNSSTFDQGCLWREQLFVSPQSIHSPGLIPIILLLQHGFWFCVLTCPKLARFQIKLFVASCFPSFRFDTLVMTPGISLPPQEHRGQKWQRLWEELTFYPPELHFLFYWNFNRVSSLEMLRFTENENSLHVIKLELKLYFSLLCLDAQYISFCCYLTMRWFFFDIWQKHLINLYFL